MPGSIGQIKIVGHQYVGFIKLHGPGVAEVGGSSVRTENDLGGGGEVSALGVEDPGPNTKGGVAVTVGKQYPLVWQA